MWNLDLRRKSVEYWYRMMNVGVVMPEMAAGKKAMRRVVVRDLK